MLKPIIRPVQQNDNPALAKLIRETLTEFGAPESGTVFEDESLDCMFETYQLPKSRYFVVEENGKILGGAGIAPLKGEGGNICEIQKMYILPKIRGCGLGALLMRKCLDFAQENEFSTCYLETLPTMESAQKLYRKTGFELLEKQMGNTGHFSCNVWMALRL